ncbi:MULTISPECIES: type I phosphomannose isomerase catalytic subunit [Salegentibacter]|uniref:Phosphohexomutase n=1 Tax=Salegentibacter maritimus TaxID=2794347 RepID=A0ABS0TFT7_9FLAO|nr:MULTISPECIES: type I phosphomannose isomerase catalytic subunit [Salegentibacter]MBE7638854.1 mannose-6-phosphate isomerase [Salegentibacter sp. BLCTC]MBI6115194.1 class I mannose-6-phosphate isomerase [Salegentibacter maritimus]MBI6118878.1 class I mannose-6-phosphate isomerase [Salegentibacter maritimus]
MLDYPIKFTPILKEKIWGGNKLKNNLNKETTQSNLGESWEISGVPGDISVVANGKLKGSSLKDLLNDYKAKIVGEKIYKEFDNDFPLLIKFIDAKTELSVQLHPNDELAQQRHNSFGKTEMWYIMQADKGAKINVGFKESISKEDYISRLEEGKIVELLNFEEVKKGDSFFINTGKVHAIGAGVLLAEIQQTSDVTYRIYDWDRTDDEGNSRELHTALAIDAIDFEKKDDFKLNYTRAANTSSEVASCKYFTTNYLPVKGNIQKDYSNLDSFVIYMCVGGSGEISVNGNSENIKQGETMLIPAENKQVEISAKNCELLEVYIK